MGYEADGWRGDGYTQSRDHVSYNQQAGGPQIRSPRFSMFGANVVCRLAPESTVAEAGVTDDF